MCEVRDLKPNGANILVTEENKKEYVHLVCQMKMTGEFIFKPLSKKEVVMKNTSSIYCQPMAPL